MSIHRHRLNGRGGPLAGIEGRTEKLGCYSGMHEAKAFVLAPADPTQLHQIFAYAARSGQSVTLRGGAHSFADQSLGRSLVVSMRKFTTIEIDQARRHVTVGAGANWQKIVEALQPHGLLPAGTVTSSQATAGGTVSADCLSRFSPRYGKEGARVERFSLLTTTGVRLECTRPPTDAAPSTWTDAQRRFMAAISGFGYLGAIVEITYNLLSVGPDPVAVRTRIRSYSSFQDLGEQLVPAVHATTSPVHAVWAGLYPAGPNCESWMLFASELTTTRRRRRLIMYRRRGLVRIAGEWLMRRPAFCRLLSWCFYTYMRLLGDRAVYVDDLNDFLFFMDANARAKRIGRRFGFKMRTLQQTFVVPVDLPESSPADAQDVLVKWLRRAHDLFDSHDLTPTLQDVGFLLEELPFLLSPNAGRPGFAVSYAFETSRSRTIERVKQAFTELSDALESEFGGRVSLVKNVYAKPATLELMYGADARAFFALKHRLDPRCVLRNEFLERTFPGAC